MKRAPMVVFALVLAVPLWAAKSASSPYKEAVDLYQAGRFTEATDAFNKAIQKKDHIAESQKYIERIRQEAVERIRNKALVGDSKMNWKNKFFYARSAEGRIQAGISVDEIFEKDSLNFRPDAVNALGDLADILRRSDNSTVTVDLINERPQDSGTDNTELVAQQTVAVFSFLSLASHDQLPH